MTAKYEKMNVCGLLEIYQSGLCWFHMKKTSSSYTLVSTTAMLIDSAGWKYTESTVALAGVISGRIQVELK